MIRKHISSSQNETFKYLNSLKTKNGREKAGCYLIEGIKLLKEAEKSNKRILHVLVKGAYSNQYVKLFNDFDIFELEDRLFDKLSYMVHSEGVMAVVARDPENVMDFQGQRILFLDGVSDPGNLGTILRSAEAFGFKDVLLAPDTADVYNPKTIRGTMGSLFRLKVQYGEYEILNTLKEQGYEILTTHLSGSDYTDRPYEERTVIVIGNESRGVSDRVSSLSDSLIKIPMKGNVESLNAAISASIIMSHFDMKIR